VNDLLVSLDIIGALGVIACLVMVAILLFNRNDDNDPRA